MLWNWLPILLNPMRSSNTGFSQWYFNFLITIVIWIRSVVPILVYYMLKLFAYPLLYVVVHQTLSNCRNEVCKALGLTEEQCELSMGMSGDFEKAVLFKTKLKAQSSIKLQSFSLVLRLYAKYRECFIIGSFNGYYGEIPLLATWQHETP